MYAKMQEIYNHRYIKSPMLNSGNLAKPIKKDPVVDDDNRVRSMLSNLEHFSRSVLKSHSVLKQNSSYQGWDSQNACQNSNRENPEQTAFEKNLSDLGLYCLSGPFEQAL